MMRGVTGGGYALCIHKEISVKFKYTRAHARMCVCAHILLCCVIMLRCVADRVGAAVAAICGYVPGKDYGMRGGAVFVEKICPKII